MEEQENPRTRTVDNSYIPCPPCSFNVDPVSKKATFPLRFQPQRYSTGAVPISFEPEQRNCEFKRIGAHRARKPNYQRYPKPPYSYTGMITTAIMNSEEKKLTLCDIQRSIENMFPFFRGEYKGWKDSVRHNLSHCDAFIKINKNTSRMNTKFNFWGVDLNKLPLDVFKRKVNVKGSRYAEFLHDELGTQEIILPRDIMTERHHDNIVEPPAKRFKSDSVNNSFQGCSDIKGYEVSHDSTKDFRYNSNGDGLSETKRNVFQIGSNPKEGTKTETMTNGGLYNDLDNLIEQSLFKASNTNAPPVFDFGGMKPHLSKTFEEYKYANYDYPALNTSLVLERCDMTCNSDVYAISPPQLVSSRVTRHSYTMTPIKYGEQETCPDLATCGLVLSPTIRRSKEERSNEVKSTVYNMEQYTEVQPSILSSSLSNIFDI